MPELPEVETTRRGIAPLLHGRRVVGLRISQPQLRWPVPVEALRAELVGTRVTGITRRAKYLLLAAERGWAILHLGMSGTLRHLPAGTPPGRHDHWDLLLAGETLLRFNDPRRFGALLWTREPPEGHPLLSGLGPEPLGEAFDGAHLYRLSRDRRGAVKGFLMDGRVVVGVGNIYANEALFLAGVHPARAAGRVGRERYQALAVAVRQVLAAAIEAGGTTLRDFQQADGRPGYFAQELRAYGREGLPCLRCGTPLQGVRIGQRASVFCPRCQR